MNAKCCGVQMERLTSDREGFDARQHVWFCHTCKGFRTQKTRQAKGDNLGRIKQGRTEQERMMKRVARLAEERR